MKYVLLALSLTLGSIAHADQAATTQALFTMSNDRDSGVDVYGLELNNGVPVGFMTAPQNDANRAQTFSFADIAKPNGVVVLSGQGHNVMFLQGQVDRSGQGRLHFKYLSNGLSNQYTTCDFNLMKDANNTYFAQNAYNGARITSARIVTWSLGLKTLQGICQ